MFNFNKEDWKNYLIQVFGMLTVMGITATKAYFTSETLNSWDNFIAWFVQVTPIYNWVWLLVVGILSFWAVGLIIPRIKKSKSIKENQRLEKIEEDILLYLSEEGKATVQIFKHFSNIPSVKLFYYMEELSRKFFLQYDKYTYKYHLLQPGRGYLVKNKLV